MSRAKVITLKLVEYCAEQSWILQFKLFFRLTPSAVFSSVKLFTSLQRILRIKMFKYSLIIQVVYEDLTMVHLSSPYVPEYLAFREVEFLVNCVSRLLKSKPELVPQVILVDGNGMLHPRGLISHYFKWIMYLLGGVDQCIGWYLGQLSIKILDAMSVKSRPSLGKESVDILAEWHCPVGWRKGRYLGRR